MISLAFDARRSDVLSIRSAAAGWEAIRFCWSGGYVVGIACPRAIDANTGLRQTATAALNAHRCIWFALIAVAPDLSSSEERSQHALCHRTVKTVTQTS